MMIPPNPQDPIFAILNRFRETQILLLATEINLFPTLAQHPGLNASQLGEALNMQARAVQSLVSVCCNLDLLTLDNDKYFLSQTAQDFLLPDSPYSWLPMIQMALGEPAITSYDALKKSFLSNQAQISGGDDFFQENEMSEPATRFFTMAMHAKSLAGAAYWPRVAKLEAHQHMLDIAGGSGVHSIAAAQAFPHLRATVLERPLVCSIARDYIQNAGLQARIHTHEANMWSDPLPEADLHFYCDVLHDWPPAKCRSLLEKSFAALPSGGEILIHEMLFNDSKTGPANTAYYNLTMLFWTEGQQFSSPELRAMLSQTGFADVAINATGYGSWHLISARKP